MKQSIRWVFLFVFALIILGCSRATPITNSLAEPEQIATVTPGAAPKLDAGAAPDFQSQARPVRALGTSLRNPLFYESLIRWARNFEVNQGGVVWISILIALIVAFNFKRFGSLRNLDLALLLLPGIFLVNLVTIGNTPVDDGDEILFTFLYLGLFLSTIGLFIRGVMRTYHSERYEFLPNLPRVALVILTVLFLILNIFYALIRRPDDAGAYTNIGAYQMLKTGHFPYGDTNLRGGAAATYGPVLYLSHMPFQIILEPVVDRLDSQSMLYRLIVGNDDRDYAGPPLLATKLTVIAYFILAVGSLYFIGQQLSNSTVGWALALLFVSSTYVQGLGGEEWLITGMTYISHIAPIALTLLAFWFVKKHPLAAGVLLATGAGALYYPVFFFPAWFGYYFWQRSGWARFLAGFAVTAAVILACVLLFTQSAPGETVWHAIYESTVGHQEAQNAYGSSTFSFWSTQPKLADLWQQQLIPGQYLLRPSVIIFAAFIIATFFIVRRRSQIQLAALTAAIAIAVQLWKSHAGGSYVEWYYPFFLIGLFCTGQALHQSGLAGEVEQQVEAA